MKRMLPVLALVLLLAACSKPRQPDWLVNADSAQERYERAYLRGNDRVARAEFALFVNAVTSTANVDLVARAELTRCAVQVASLQFEPCTGFEPLRAHASPQERAYADFLAGRATPEQAALLPRQYRAVAAGEPGPRAVDRIEPPISRLIAAGVLLRTGRADDAVLEAATEAASGQGWRRAVLAWLAARVVAAERAGNTEEAARLRFRMQLAAQEPER